MSVEDTVLEFLTNFSIRPTDNRWTVFHHLFSVIGNGYEWKDGELVVRREREDDYEWKNKITPDILERAKDLTPPCDLIPTREQAEKWKRHIKDGLRMLTEKMKDSELKRKVYEISEFKFSEDIYQECVEEWKKDFPDLHTCLYPMSSKFSRVGRYPENLKEDWAKARQEWGDYLRKNGEWIED